MRFIKNAVLGLTICTTLFACNEEKKQEEKSTKKAEVLLPAPFKKHLKVEVGPELIFDIYSWGRGSDSSSSVLVLRSDSVKNEFSVASSDNLDGRLQEVFNTDMDTDGNPEIVILYTKNDKYNSAEVLCYEFSGKGANKIKFPDLTSKTKKQYRGLDKFYVKEGDLYREFNLYSETDTSNNTGKKMVLKYFLNRNQFDLNEIKE
ncbi:hypothetical protein [Pedobacter alpinus]|uniref:Lipoprotein n=1 Tax=Pedobacter alpinus TaxID=1590643 RepID=A0ABW5TXS6_9SPHI